jgi:3-dehydrotetronate 4-kinase
MLLGCITDDLTGATDLALTLTRGGMRTVQVMDAPQGGADFEHFDAVVVAQKSRTIPAASAVAMALESAEALLACGARQLFFKYCSTFDSTDSGNIGPVADALLDRLKEEFTIACPAFPTNKRTIYMGNLFVGELPLAESPMKDHPLTPMHDSNLVRVLQKQSKRKVGLIPLSVVECGSADIRKEFSRARLRHESYAIIDAITDQHLLEIGSAAAELRLITGGSGVALGLPANFMRQGYLKQNRASQSMLAPSGRALILAGSCSEATRSQVRTAIEAGIPSYRLEPAHLAKNMQLTDDACAWAMKQSADEPVLIYSSADPVAVSAAQELLGRNRAGQLVEDALAATARRLVECGFTRIVVAGGETSGAVVNGLNVKALEIGPEIDPGIPWTRNVGEPHLVLALKSGNFGGPDFFLKAWDRLT